MAAKERVGHGVCPCCKRTFKQLAAHIEASASSFRGDGVSYRPITDVWILARPKVKYYGAYPAGFLHRARALLGVSPTDTVLHVCAGRVRDYPYSGFGPEDITVDGASETDPDFFLDVTRDRWTVHFGDCNVKGVLADPPYTPTDAKQYAAGSLPFPGSSKLMADCLQLVPVGHRVGMLHYEWPRCPKTAKEVAVICVTTGRGQRGRLFTVMERLE